MSAAMPKDFCPYKGLQPYTEGDRAFFFGRERDAQVIISNLYAAPLTVFYGASGVGKSSVLLAGAAPLLRKSGTFRLSSFAIGRTQISSPNSNNARWKPSVAWPANKSTSITRFPWMNFCVAYRKLLMACLFFCRSV